MVEILVKHCSLYNKRFFLTVTRWSRSTSNFYALIGQNLTGEFMRKIYAASGNLLTDSLFATTWPKITTSSAGAMLGDNQTIKMAVVTWRDRREGPSSILRLGPSYTIAAFNRRVNLRFCIDHRIAMAKKWRVKESEWILASVFKKMRCDLFCFLFFFM